MVVARISAQRCIWAAAVAVYGWGGGTLVPAARGDAFEGYRRAGQFSLPAGAAAFDALADGRVVAVAGATVYVETAVRSRQFASLGVLADADIPGFGAAFLRVSPDGARLAVGNNGGTLGDNYEVGVFSTTDLSGRWLTAAHFDAGWVDNTLLAITYGDFVNPSVVSILDVDSADPQSPSNVVVIDGIGGASGGVAFDAVGNLYTGNGFQFAGPSGTGVVKAFPASQWLTAYQSSTPLNFESQGLCIVDALSASPLSFDSEGNLIIGGGDFSDENQKDYVGMARAAAVARAAGGGAPVNTADSAEFRRVDPDASNDFNFYTLAYNAALGELYVRDFGSDVAYVYLDITGIPAMSAWSLISLSLLSASAGTVILSRRSAGKDDSLRLTTQGRGDW